MPYSVKSSKNGTTYYLHSKETNSRGGKRTLYYFAKSVQKEGGAVPLEAIPEGYQLTESAQTGLPLLTKQKRAG